MPELITIDADEPPEVGLVPDGLGWSRVEEYVRITHRPVLAPLPEGVVKFRASSGIPVGRQSAQRKISGPGQQVALSKFREILRRPVAQGVLVRGRRLRSAWSLAGSFSMQWSQD
jgi:hypothetical protein